jgi:rod shape-determining protein MreD
MIGFAFTLVFVMAFILQTTLFRIFGSVAPDLILLTSIYCGLRFGKLSGIQIGAFSGLVQDTLSYGLLGINFLSKGLIGFSTGFLREMNLIIGNSMLMWMILIFLSTAIDVTLLLVALNSFYDAPISIANIAWSIIIQSILNIAIGVPYFFLLDRMQEYFRKAFAIHEY